MAEAFIGEIRLFPYQFAPRDWMACEGQVLQIAQYTALYAVLGTIYGGNGQTNFALPDLRGCVAMGSGMGSGLTPRTIGDRVGQEQVVLSSHSVPAHKHGFKVSGDPADKTSPTGHVYAEGGNLYIDSPQTKVTMGAQTVGHAGGNQHGGADPHENMAPYLAMRFCICIDGYFPTHS